MGKRIIQQARGHGSLTYQVRKQAYIYRIGYPAGTGKAIILKLLNSMAHSSPLAKIKLGKEIFYNPAFNLAEEGQEIEVGGSEVKDGNILALEKAPIGTRVYNIETRPGDGGKLVRTSGNSAVVSKKLPSQTALMMPSKREILFDNKCRATVGEIAGGGRTEKPLLKAGKVWHMKKARNKLWPRTSAVKMNVVDHPFGSGRGKRIKAKIAKRNVPPGAKVGHIRPRRTGRKK